ncbi:hypothetical protein ACTXM3_08425 [Glutamicibacter arilaitensis]|uniref:hypothetical protein n=1 Tax=Glutamicibacter arilaitensis TaxID=256701 RepID=UPI003FD1483D
MFGATVKADAPIGKENAANVESTFNDLWSTVIASDPQTERALWVVGLVLVCCAVAGGLFTIKKGLLKTGIAIFFASIPGIFLMYPQEVLSAIIGLIGIVWGLILRLGEFIFGG